jgi:hypothetical protein
MCGSQHRVWLPGESTGCGCPPEDLRCAMKCGLTRNNTEPWKPPGGWPVVEVDSEASPTCILIIERDGFESKEITLTPKDGLTAANKARTSSIGIPLASTPGPCPNTGVLHLYAEPPANVSVDGRSLGQTPTTATVLAGGHTVLFERQDESDRQSKVVNAYVDSGALRRVHVQFP